ncbi:glycoside hydrolase family 16 protein [Streptomyces sp. NBC_00638]|uniref:glycoside hydrolase family 16 protein n=1 Tax=unclassified Streptomyces TaxID=2593676 RepID=UPI00225002EE|nr:glycoside hydrolase family 16 protein [Streptomyces sp. NBC_00638]MCX5008179.1 glycoside hydrolase family 16 protein [Streptomyces sp. NBC_00638]
MGSHAAPGRRRRALFMPLGLVLLAGALFWVPRADGAPRSADACHDTGTALPRGDCGPFWQVLAEDFNGDRVPLGSFGDCDHRVDTSGAFCGGLSGKYRDNWWAYPAGWEDTANDRGRDVVGEYHPEDTVSVGPGENGDGVMRIRMWRPEDRGPVHAAAVVPRAVMQMTYGKYSARIKVTKAAPGYKSAWLHYGGGCEMDHPEGEWTGSLTAFHHPCGGGEQGYFPSDAAWTEWHTVSTEWTPGHVRFFVDGRQTGEDTRGVPSAPLSWVLQNESALEGPGAAPGSSAELDITWVAAYAYGWK